MRGPTCIFWANLTPFSLGRKELAMLAAKLGYVEAAVADQVSKAVQHGEGHTRPIVVVKCF